MDLLEFACPEDAIKIDPNTKQESCSQLELDMLECSWPECPSFNSSYNDSLIASKAILIEESGTEMNSTVEVQCIEPGKISFGICPKSTINVNMHISCTHS